MKKKNLLLSWLKSMGISLSITVIVIAVSALFVINIDASAGLLNIIMLLCKIVSIFAGSFVLVKSIGKKGFLLGSVFGILYWLICFLISVITKTVNSSIPAFDIAFSAVIGAISGIIWANVFSKK